MARTPPPHGSDPDERKRAAIAAVGPRLRELRVERGILMAQAAEGAGVSYSYLSDVERGTRLPPLDTLDAMANALGLHVIDVLRGLHPFDGDASPPPR